MKIKKILVLVVIGFMMITLAACSGSNATSGTSEDGKVTGDAQTITFAHVSAESTSTHQAALRFKELIEDNSNGQLTVNVYPNAQLGGDRELIEGTQNGSITAMLSSPAPQVNFVPAATIFDTPFVFDDIEHARKVMDDTTFTEEIRKEYEASGFHYIGTSSQGFRTLTSNRQISNLEDLRGLTIRTMENEYHLRTWRELGANPTPLTFSELYTALQQGTVEAQENPVELVHSQKFFEQQKYIYNTNHILQTNAWIVNKGFYDSLSDELKTVIDEAGKEAIAFANQYNDEHEPQYIQDMVDYGCDVVELSSEELARFSEATAPVLELIEEATTSEVHDAYFSAIANYREN